jgi:hypothetical protein
MELPEASEPTQAAHVHPDLGCGQEDLISGAVSIGPLRCGRFEARNIVRDPIGQPLGLLWTATVLSFVPSGKAAVTTDCQPGAQSSIHTELLGGGGHVPLGRSGDDHRLVPGSLVVGEALGHLRAEVTADVVGSEPSGLFEDLVGG